MDTIAKKITNMITVNDLSDEKTLKEIFDEKTISYIKGAESYYSAKKLGSGIELIYKTKVQSNKTECLKYMFYFPDYCETISFIHKTDNNGECESKFTFSKKEFSKSYFNVMVLDKNNNIVLSEAIVFDENANIRELQNIDKIKSSHSLERSWIEQIQVVDSFGVGINKYKLRQYTQFKDVEKDFEITHVWQNMTISKREKLKVTKENLIVFSDLSYDEEYFSKDIWMIMSIDEKNKLISQGIVSIS